MVNCCTESFCYGEDIPFTPVTVPEEVFYVEGVLYRFAA